MSVSQAADGKLQQAAQQHGFSLQSLFDFITKLDWATFAALISQIVTLFWQKPATIKKGAQGCSADELECCRMHFNLCSQICACGEKHCGGG